MDSFYGGLNGQSFSIKEKFTTKVQLDNDLSKGWTSPIQPGEFVVVSYGMPSDASYDDYKNADLRAYNKSYNSTLWRKYYDESVGNANGLAYELIASMTGNTPRIALENTVVLNADQVPDIDWDNTDLDKLILTFKLPRSQVLSLDVPAGVLDCDEEPTVIMDSTDVNYPVLYFALPQSQVINQATVTWLNVGEKPKVELNLTNINRPVLEFSLPVAQSLKEGLTTILDADQMPSFNIDFSNIDEPILNFSLPQSQVMADPETTVYGPETSPSVALDNSNINAPKLKFSLPRAVRFYYGELLGERTSGTYTLTNDAFVEYEVGDYYINAHTGFIYKVITKNDTTCEFEYVASIQQPLPDVVAVGISPYVLGEDGTYTRAVPVVTRTFTNDEETAWKIEFQMPKAVEYDTAFEFIGIDEVGSVTASIKDENTVLLDFKIPRGAKVFAGTAVSDAQTTTVVEGAKTGDLYINGELGYIYQLSAAGTWVKQSQGLKGDVGNALNIVASYTIEETETLADSLDNGVAYIEANYTGEINAEDIFAVTWVDLDGQETSYWYYKALNGVWGRVQLTGGVMNLIENAYNDESSGEVSNKTYSVHYINTLIGGDVATKDKTKVTYSAEQIEELLSWGSFSDLIPTSGD